MERWYIAIDLKSFYASVECRERGLDPLTTNLVVADASRTAKTICLAVSPALKSHGIPGRPRLFEVIQRVEEINAERKRANGYRELEGEEVNDLIIRQNPALKLHYITAPPRMALYMKYSTAIYKIYLRHIAPEDIHVYSVDEVFIDATAYLRHARTMPRALCMQMIREVLEETGITATAGIGTNLYLAKVAMDIVAKHSRPDENGVRIAELDELSYRELLWNHRPLTDFWRVGPGTAKKLEAHGLYTMGDIARCSIGGDGDVQNEELLYRLFGINAGLLIDHAWGWEPARICDIHAYRPGDRSIGAGQVLHCPYDYGKARLIVQEMADALSFTLLDKALVTKQIVLTIGYDVANLADPERAKRYKGAVKKDHYGRKVPKHAHGSGNLQGYTSSAKRIMETSLELYERIVNKDLLVRRIYISANHVLSEQDAARQRETRYEQLDLFTDYAALEKKERAEQQEEERERKMQQAVLSLRKRFGKNSVVRGLNLREGGTMIQRNGQIGGHRAGE